MALPAILTVAGTAGFLASEVAPAASGGSTSSIVVGGVVAVLVALIGGGVQVWVSRRRKDPNSESELTIAARVAVLETNQAELKRSIDTVLDHVRPWPTKERRTR